MVVKITRILNASTDYLFQENLQTFKEYPTKDNNTWSHFRKKSIGGGYFIELAKVASKGQITITLMIRNKAQPKTGNKVFFEKKTCSKSNFVL